jgi:hypothetical protein
MISWIHFVKMKSEFGGLGRAERSAFESSVVPQRKQGKEAPPPQGISRD